MATKTTKQSADLGFFETTVGRAVRRAGVLALSGAVTAFLGTLANDPALSHATVKDGLPFFFYWTVRTCLDLRNPKITNL